MNDPGQFSPSGVWIADDFRSNLIIDRYDPVFSDMRASKLKHLRSANSEDAVTWNVFRTLRQINPKAWFPALWQRAFPEIDRPSHDLVMIRLWKTVAPPIGLLAGGDEGPSEIDIMIESPEWVWFIEAKLKSDISTGTTTRPDRDQVLRNLDVGTYYAGVRRFFFSLLISSEKYSRAGVERLIKYRDLEFTKKNLPHRKDGLLNLVSLSLLTWAQLLEVLQAAQENPAQEDEREYAARAVKWLKERSIG